MFGFMYDVCITGGAAGADSALYLARYRLRLALLGKETALPADKAARLAAEDGVELCLGTALRAIRRIPLGFELESESGECRYARFILNTGPRGELPGLVGGACPGGDGEPFVPGIVEMAGRKAAAPVGTAEYAAGLLEKMGLPLVPRRFVPDWYKRCL